MGNDESILLGFMKYVSDALNQHGNHKCLMKGWDTPEGIGILLLSYHGYTTHG